MWRKQFKDKGKEKRKKNTTICASPVVSVAEFYFVHYFIEKLSV